MKQLLTLMVLLSSVSICCAQVQTPKWSFAVNAPLGYTGAFVKHSVFDGSGGSAWNLTFDGEGLGRVSSIAWLDLNGRPIYTNTFSAPPFSRASVRIARFTRTELALQVRVDADNGSATNYLLRIRKARVGVSLLQLPIGSGEDVGGTAGVPSDIRGLFTSQAEGEAVVIRRYIN
jgi:hypothetical protein